MTTASLTGFDWVVLALIPIIAFAGYRLGFLVSALSFGGFVLGVLVGLAVAPYLLGATDPGPVRSLVAFAVVLGLGVLFQAAGSFVGGTARESLEGRFTRRLDAGFGALVALVALMAGAWLIGHAASRAGDLAFAQSARDSRVVAAVGASVPVDPDALLASFATLVNRSGFPAVFAGAGLEIIAPIPPPDESVLLAPGVRAAADRLVKVTTEAPSCGRQFEGSGFVSSPGRVMTNAHVVAGSETVRVSVAGSPRIYAGTVVYFDPKADVAVVWVPDLAASPLPIGSDLVRGDEGVVAGFPGDGPLRATPARVRGQVLAVGSDIYDVAEVEREVYSLRARVQPGNSGGPLLDPTGAVVGLVFAASVSDADTGYALTPDEFRPALRASRTAEVAVATGACAG